MGIHLNRWLLIWTTAAATGLIVGLGADFVVAGVGWISWVEAALAAPLITGLIGAALGWLNPNRFDVDLWKTAALACGLLFALVVLQYAATIASTAGECDPGVSSNCFDEHAAAVGGMGFFGGLTILCVVMATVACAGASIRRRHRRRSLRQGMRQS